MEYYTLYFDGACWPNPGGKGGGGFAIYKNYELVYNDHFSLAAGEHMSNNTAEYEALNMGLEWFLKNTSKGEKYSIYVYGDSDLVIKQMQGKWRVKGGRYFQSGKKTLSTAKLLRKYGVTINFEWIPRENNTFCDELSKKYLTKENSCDRVEKNNVSLSLETGG